MPLPLSHCCPLAYSSRSSFISFKPAGYLLNAAIRIAPPGHLVPVFDEARNLGFGHYVDQFEASMNSAAEHAAPLAMSIFEDTIRRMDIDDVKRVWKGGEDSATQFLHNKCFESLKAALREACDSILDQHKLTHFYNKAVEEARELPVIGKMAAEYDIKDTKR